MLLNTLHAPLNPGQRAGVYLTNALNGWEPTTEPKTLLMFPELQRERDAADTVKRSRPILVILGNPPYSGFAGVAIEEERTLSQAYRTTQNPNLPRPQGQGLNDLYVRFYRMAERQIAENTQRGIVCFISNYSWLDGLSHPGMRERYLEAFDIVTIDNLNGDKYKTGKTTPDGKPDPSIFSTEFNREGIQVGTAIATLVRKPQHEGAQTVRFRHLWGTGKRAQLQAEATDTGAGSYQDVTPSLEIGLPFLPHTFGEDYFAWAKLPELFTISFPGVKTSRDDVLIDVDKERLEARMKQYFDLTISHEDMRRIAPGFMTDSARYNAQAVRDTLRQRGYLPENIVRYSYRPFDVRWLYWEPETKLLDEKRSEYFPHVQPGNIWIEARQRQPMELFDRGIFTRVLGDNLGNGLSSFFPLYLYATRQAQLSLFAAEQVRSADVSPT
ncbi:hypothetical protein HC928_08965 [bacterium]|nr:hypothetical protein [bacterium]